MRKRPVTYSAGPVTDGAYREVYRCLSPEREWIEMQRLEAAITVEPEVIGSYLDENWKGWRQGNQETDYILMPTAMGLGPVMIGNDSKPGWLDINGERFYSAAWL